MEHQCQLTFLRLRELDLVVLLARAEELVEAEELMRDEEGNVDLARDPVVDLEASGIDEKDVGEGGEASRSAGVATVSERNVDEKVSGSLDSLDSFDASRALVLDRSRRSQGVEAGEELDRLVLDLLVLLAFRRLLLLLHHHWYRHRQQLLTLLPLVAHSLALGTLQPLLLSEAEDFGGVLGPFRPRRATNDLEEVGEKLAGILLPHRRELGVILPDESLEHTRSNAFLEHNFGRRLLLGAGSVAWLCVVVVELARDGVTTGEKSVGNLAHLALKARGGIRVGAGGRVSVEGSEVALLERGEGEEGLERGGHVAAVQIDPLVSSLASQSERRAYLLPRFRNPVKPGPVRGSNSLPSAPVMAKSKLRFCSTCYKPMVTVSKLS